MKIRIALADNNDLKFCKDIKEHWEQQRHEVRFERGASEYLAQWADIYWIDFADYNLAYLFKLYHGDSSVSRPDDWDNSRKPLVVVRAIDWEIWTLAMHRDQTIVDWVDKWICIAPHIEKKLRAEASFRDGQLKLIRPGVNLEKFTLKETKTDGFQLGMVLGDFWPQAKNHMAGLDIFTTLYRKNNRWRLHIRGQHEKGDYWPLMYEHYLDSRSIRDVVTLYGQVTDMNQWLEQIDILLHPSMKEAFCYAIGEAMAKGIKVIANEFYGSRHIWPAWMFYQTHQEAVEMIIKEKNNFYKIHPRNRQYIQENHSLEKMLKEIDEYLGD